MKTELYNQIEDYMKSCVKETAHDCEHIYRVLNNCLVIAQNEKDVDYEVLITAALLHDIGRDGKLKKHNEIGADMAYEFLNTINFPENKIEDVCHAILCHSNVCYGMQKTLEAKILYDADKLDAVGVMGISRALVGTGNYNNPMYVLKNGTVDLSENSETDCFVRYYVKHLSKNYDRFFTETARKIALKHKEVDEAFFSAFLESVNPNENLNVNIYFDK
ncbi:MAG: HD domain-containing protein [Eubacterium sp.]|nr:HD domain-containing protein [Eubacterium sp.]